MKLAGRCHCGFAMERVARRPDEHMRCFRLRWCPKCGEVAQVGKLCKPCRNRREAAKHLLLTRNPYLRELRRLKHTAYVRRRMADPMHAHVHRQQAKRWEAKQRWKNTPHYQKQKALHYVGYWAKKVVALLAAHRQPLREAA